MLQPKGSRQEILRSPELKRLIVRNSIIGAVIGLVLGLAGAVGWTQAANGAFSLLATLPIGGLFGAGLFALLGYRITDVYLMFTYENRLQKSMLPPMTENKELVDRFTRKK